MKKMKKKKKRKKKKNKVSLYFVLWFYLKAIDDFRKRTTFKKDKKCTSTKNKKNSIHHKKNLQQNYSIINKDDTHKQLQTQKIKVTIFTMTV